MPNAEAQAIIDHARSSRAAYEAMAAEEAAVWSRSLTDPKRDAANAEDNAAAAALGLQERQFSLQAWMKAERQTFRRGLSLGCGAGRAERMHLREGVAAGFHGIDIAAGAVAEARSEAERLGLDCTYEVADLNFADLGEARYDLVIAQTALHHLVYLEDVLDRISRALVPGGIFWLHDYVGESQFQHSDLRLEIANRILAALPEALVINRRNGRPIRPVKRRKPGTLVSPFESIRSGEILPLVRERFEFVAGGTFSSILHLVVPRGTRANYTEMPEGKALFDVIRATDEALIATGVLEGTGARMIFRKR